MGEDDGEDVGDDSASDEDEPAAAGVNHSPFAFQPTATLLAEARYLTGLATWPLGCTAAVWGASIESSPAGAC